MSLDLTLFTDNFEPNSTEKDDIEKLIINTRKRELANNSDLKQIQLSAFLGLYSKCKYDPKNNRIIPTELETVEKRSFWNFYFSSLGEKISNITRINNEIKVVNTQKSDATANKKLLQSEIDRLNKDKADLITLLEKYKDPSKLEYKGNENVRLIFNYDSFVLDYSPPSIKERKLKLIAEERKEREHQKLLLKRAKMRKMILTGIGLSSVILGAGAGISSFTKPSKTRSFEVIEEVIEPQYVPNITPKYLRYCIQSHKIEVTKAFYHAIDIQVTGMLRNKDEITFKDSSNPKYVGSKFGDFSVSSYSLNDTEYIETITPYSFTKTTNYWSLNKLASTTRRIPKTEFLTSIEQICQSETLKTKSQWKGQTDSENYVLYYKSKKIGIIKQAQIPQPMLKTIQLPLFILPREIVILGYNNSETPSELIEYNYNTTYPLAVTLGAVIINPDKF